MAGRICAPQMRPDGIQQQGIFRPRQEKGDARAIGRCTAAAGMARYGTVLCVMRGRTDTDAALHETDMVFAQPEHGPPQLGDPP
jgi:hypothetical protein